MKNYEFRKDSIEEMYQDTVDEIFKALDEGTIDKLNIEIKIGNQAISIPNNADNFEIIMAAIKDCEANNY